MFRSMSGFKAHYHYLTLLVISEFNEWRVLVYGPRMVKILMRRGCNI